MEVKRVSGMGLRVYAQEFGVWGLRVWWIGVA